MITFIIILLILWIFAWFGSNPKCPNCNDRHWKQPYLGRFWECQTCYTLYDPILKDWKDVDGNYHDQVIENYK